MTGFGFLKYRLRHVTILALLASTAIPATCLALQPGTGDVTLPPPAVQNTGPFGEAPGAIPLLGSNAQAAAAAPTPESASGTAVNATPALPGADITPHMSEVDQLSELQRQLLILKLQQQVLDLQVSIAKTKSDAADVTGDAPVATTTGTSAAPVTVAPSPAQTAAAMAAQAALDQLPKVASIGGVSGHYSADILVPYAGEYANVHVGDLLPNNITVTNINSEGVIVRLGNGQTTLLSEGYSVPASLDGVGTAGITHAANPQASLGTPQGMPPLPASMAQFHPVATTTTAPAPTSSGMPAAPAKPGVFSMPTSVPQIIARPAPTGN